MGMKDKIILVDVDDTLLDYDTGVYDYFIKIGLELVDDHDMHLHYYDKFGLCKESVVKYFNMFNESSDFGKLLPYKNSDKYVLDIASLGYKFIAITACGTNTATISSRTQNLYNVYGDCFDAVYCIDIRQSKADVLAMFKDSDVIWVDDLPMHVLEGYKQGLQSFLMPTAYNKDFNVMSDCVTVLNEDNPWNHLYSIISSKRG